MMERLPALGSIPELVVHHWVFGNDALNSYFLLEPNSRPTRGQTWLKQKNYINFEPIIVNKLALSLVVAQPVSNLNNANQIKSYYGFTLLVIFPLGIWNQRKCYLHLAKSHRECNLLFAII